jgi:hypothetical protein
MDILQKIKDALKKAGIDEKYAGKVKALFQIEKEDGLDNYIKLFKDNILPDLQANEQTQQAAVEAAKKEAVAAYEKEHKLKDGKTIEQPKPDEDPLKDLPPAAKAIFEAQNKQIKALTDSMANLTNTVTTNTKKDSAKAIFIESKLPEKWFDRIDVNSDIPVKDQIKTLQDEYTEIRQSVINEEIGDGHYSPGDSKITEKSEEDWAKIMDGEPAKDSGTVDLGLK